MSVFRGTIGVGLGVVLTAEPNVFDLAQRRHQKKKTHNITTSKLTFRLELDVLFAAPFLRGWYVGTCFAVLAANKHLSRGDSSHG